MRREIRAACGSVRRMVNAGCFTLELQPEPGFQNRAWPDPHSVPLGCLVDIVARGSNNPTMARPETLRRVKTYSAATGYVYQYHFFEVQKSRRGLSPGTEYVYMVSVDRQTVFPLRIFVRRSALENWARRVGRAMTGTEEYAVAKMRLFQAFDEVEDLATARPELIVDESNLEKLLSQLDL